VASNVRQVLHGGALLPHFITVANGAVDPAVVRHGNEAVLRARYEDAKFFYEAGIHFIADHSLNRFETPCVLRHPSLVRLVCYAYACAHTLTCLS